MSSQPIDHKQAMQNNLDKMSDIITKLNNGENVDFTGAPAIISDLQRNLLDFISSKFVAIKSSNESEKAKLKSLSALFGQSLNILAEVNKHVDTLNRNTSSQ
jgi:hypothetical protein